MFGTSYSGFNSLQLACEDTPALKAVCAIYATDDRWTDDVHWRGGALRLVDLVDYCHYMTAMNMLPPVPALWGADWEQEWHRRLAVNEPWVLRLAAREHARRLLARWLGAARGGRVRLRPDRLPGAARRRLGRRLPQQLVPDRRRAAAGGRPAPAARRALGARGPGLGHARPEDRPRRRDGRLVRPVAARSWARPRGPRRRLRPVVDPPRARPGPARGLLADLALGAADRAVEPPARRPAVVAGRAGRRHGRLDRLCRAPAVGPLRRPAGRRRPFPDLGRRPTDRPPSSATPACCCASAPTPPRRRSR